MIVLHGLDDFPKAFRGGAVAIGNFDGVHRGHAHLVERLRRMAETIGGPAIVFTFDPPPVRLLRPQAAPESLVWIERKIELLADLGVDATLIYPTNQALLEIEATEFFDQIVRQQLAAKAMVEGPNFYFGRHRSGDVALLSRLCADARMPFEIATPVKIALPAQLAPPAAGTPPTDILAPAKIPGDIVSSSRIREALVAGRVAHAALLLGRPYRIRGRIVRGAGRGATIGYPTANLGSLDTLLPGEGIYSARACIEKSWHPAAVSLGPNPTFGEGKPKVEVYLIGFQGTIYDRSIEIDFLTRLRDIRRFDSVEALVEQMACDVAQTLEIAS